MRQYGAESQSDDSNAPPCGQRPREDTGLSSELEEGTPLVNAGGVASGATPGPTIPGHTGDRATLKRNASAISHDGNGKAARLLEGPLQDRKDEARIAQLDAEAAQFDADAAALHAKSAQLRADIALLRACIERRRLDAFQSR